MLDKKIVGIKTDIRKHKERKRAKNKHKETSTEHKLAKNKLERLYQAVTQKDILKQVIYPDIENIKTHSHLNDIHVQK